LRGQDQARDEDAARKAEARQSARARWRVIGIELRHAWNDFVRQPVPEDMLYLLLRLDEQ
jgi:hypothetical protein